MSNDTPSCPDSVRLSTVYALCDEHGNIRYVGITVKPLSRRLSEHLMAAQRGERTHRSFWIRSLGVPPTIHEIEQTADRTRERYWIEFHRNSGCDLTNLTNGGDSFIGRNFSEEHRANLSKALKGKPKSPEARASLSAAKAGKKVSEETRLGIISRLIGRKKSAETKAKISAAHIGMRHKDESKAKLSATRKSKFAVGELRAHMEGKQQPEETREKIRQSLLRRYEEGMPSPSKGRSVTAETRAKIGNAQRGRRASDETRAKMSASHKARRTGETKDAHGGT